MQAGNKHVSMFNKIWENCMRRAYVKLKMRSEYIEVVRGESNSHSKPQAMARPVTRNVQRCYWVLVHSLSDVNWCTCLVGYWVCSFPLLQEKEMADRSHSKHCGLATLLCSYILYELDISKEIHTTLEFKL